MAENHASKESIAAETMGEYEGRMAQFGDYTASFETIPAGFGGPELFKGLPDDACQSEHWGYLFKGSMRVTFIDGSEETVSGGDAYYLRPGHVVEALETCETLEFSPTDELNQTLEQVGKNLEAMEASAN
jgi:hypothetical protein